MLKSLQKSIMSKNKDKNKSKNTTADNPFEEMVGEDLKVYPPISKLQARNEIQNVIFKYRMAAMPAMVDDNFSPSKTRKIQSSNIFGNNFQANFLPNSTTSGGSHYWIHGINMSNYDFS